MTGICFQEQRDATWPLIFKGHSFENTFSQLLWLLAETQSLRKVFERQETPHPHPPCLTLLLFAPLHQQHWLTNHHSPSRPSPPRHGCSFCPLLFRSSLQWHLHRGLPWVSSLRLDSPWKLLPCFLSPPPQVFCVLLHPFPLDCELQWSGILKFVLSSVSISKNTISSLYMFKRIHWVFFSCIFSQKKK